MSNSPRSPRSPRSLGGGDVQLPAILQPPWNLEPPLSYRNVDDAGRIKPKGQRLLFDDEQFNTALQATGDARVGDATVALDGHTKEVTDRELRHYSAGFGVREPWPIGFPPTRRKPQLKSKDATPKKSYAAPTGPPLSAVETALKKSKMDRIQNRRLSRKKRLESMTNGARAVYELREAIVKKYGNLIRGWVLLLDRDQSGSVSRQEFIAAVLQILPDDVGEIWRRLDRDKVGSITLSSFAPKSADEVADFKRWSKESFGSLKEALDVMDTDHSGGLSCDEFCSACNKYGFESERLRLIYQSLDIEANGRLNANMIKWLDKWDPPGYLYGDADQPAYARFKEILLGRFKDNAILAWRKGLDKDSSMRVNWAEFQTACRRLKAVSAAQVPGIWRILDTYLCGYVSIDQFDHRAFELLGGFRLWVLKNFGTMIGLMQALDDGKEEDRIISLSLKEFAAGMIEIAERQSLPLTADDVEYLYNGLDLDGQGLISPDELLFLETWEMDIDLNNEADFPQFNLMGAGGSARTGGSIFKRQSFAGGLSRKSTLVGPSTSNGFGAGSSGGFG